MSAQSRWLHLSVGLFSMSLLLTACGTLPVDTVRECVENCKPHGKVFNKPTMMNLARDLDHLERHIESHGSIVIQKPAVWGQARLTQYRQEFETEMAKDIGKFEQTLQGSISRSDQAFVMNSLAISAAVSGDAAVQTVPKGTVDSTQNEIKQQIIIPTSAANLPKFVGDTDGTIASPPAFFSSAATGPKIAFVKTVQDGTDKKLEIGLEPTLVLEQKARYLNYLQQIRRTNEGDDTTDSPGYALHLMRIPVSVLPGKCTQAGHGAEVTLSLAPSLGDELLPVTFRNLVINDLVDQISKPLVGFLNSQEASKNLTQEINNSSLDDFEGGFGTATKGSEPDLREAITALQKPADAISRSRAAQKKLQAVMVKYSGSKLPSIGGSQGSRLPFPASQIYDNFGTTFAYRVAYEAFAALRNESELGSLIHFQDLQSYLKEEVTAAQKFLSTEQNSSLWTLCNRELAEAVRNRQFDEVKRMRDQYRKMVRESAMIYLREPSKDKQKIELKEKIKHIELSTTSALGWAILVNSALLNERLNNDLREVASAKGLPKPADRHDFHMPQPVPETRAAFADYVRQRWPIHVFALDPMTQDQNLADTFSTRREMQLALSMAFASGNINAQQLTRYARRIEAQYDTIAINRTAVGFSHGDDTFGWRFYPRFQTPDIESNAKVLVRDMLIGGPNREHLLNQRKLEPGIRECVAIVLMPAFVPYVNCDVTTHWFKLNNPKHRSADCTDALKLSRQVKSMQISAGNVRDADCYRDGEILRLMRKVDQLSSRLPLQSHQFQVPYENTIGGFQMFNTGVTDLAPELDGWYGAPGISTKTETTLFLVGRNLSVRNTQVVAGGRKITDVHLLSRQVMRVSVPSTVEVKKDREGRSFVDIHVATPYGVTQHLQVPTSVDTTPARSGFSIVGASGNQQAEFTLKGNMLDTLTLKPEGVTFTIVNQTSPPLDLNVKIAKFTWKLTALSNKGTATDLKEFEMADLEFKDRKVTFELNELQIKMESHLKLLSATLEDGSQLIAQAYLKVVLSDAAGDPRSLRIDLDNSLVWRAMKSR